MKKCKCPCSKLICMDKPYLALSFVRFGLAIIFAVAGVSHLIEIQNFQVMISNSLGMSTVLSVIFAWLATITLLLGATTLIFAKWLPRCLVKFMVFALLIFMGVATSVHLKSPNLSAEVMSLIHNLIYILILIGLLCTGAKCCKK